MDDKIRISFSCAGCSQPVHIIYEARNKEEYILWECETEDCDYESFIRKPVFVDYERS